MKDLATKSAHSDGALPLTPKPSTNVPVQSTDPETQHHQLGASSAETPLPFCSSPLSQSRGVKDIDANLVGLSIAWLQCKGFLDTPAETNKKATKQP